MNQAIHTDGSVQLKYVSVQMPLSPSPSPHQMNQAIHTDGSVQLKYVSVQMPLALPPALTR